MRRLELTSPSVHRRDLLSISSAPTVLSSPSGPPKVWRRHLWCVCVTLVAATHSVRWWHLPCRYGTSCATEAPPVWWWHLLCSSGTSHETAAPSLQRKHFGYTLALAEALLVHFRFGGSPFGALPVQRSTFGALPVRRKQFRSTSGLRKALSVWRKHFQFCGSTSGLEEALLV